MGKPSRKSAGKRSIGDCWVQCDRCERQEMFENNGTEGEFDPKTIDTITYVCRLCVWKNGVVERVDGLEEELREVVKRVVNVEKSLKCLSVMKEECSSVKA